MFFKLFTLLAKYLLRNDLDARLTSFRYRRYWSISPWWKTCWRSLMRFLSRSVAHGGSCRWSLTYLTGMKWWRPTLMKSVNSTNLASQLDASLTTDQSIDARKRQSSDLRLAQVSSLERVLLIGTSLGAWVVGCTKTTLWSETPNGGKICTEFLSYKSGWLVKTKSRIWLPLVGLLTNCRNLNCAAKWFTFNGLKSLQGRIPQAGNSPSTVVKVADSLTKQFLWHCRWRKDGILWPWQHRESSVGVFS